MLYKDKKDNELNAIQRYQKKFYSIEENNEKYLSYQREYKAMRLKTDPEYLERERARKRERERTGSTQLLPCSNKHKTHTHHDVLHSLEAILPTFATQVLQMGVSTRVSC